MAISSSQRSRRSSTSSATSSQGTKKRGRQLDKEGKEEDAGSPVVSPVRGTPRKKTKLEPKPEVKVMFTGLLQEEQVRKVSLTFTLYFTDFHPGDKVPWV